MVRTPFMRELIALLRLAFPIIVTGLADMAVNMTDVVMMGWLGPQAIAGGILGVHYYAFTHFFGLGVVAAVAPLVAHSLGGRRYRYVRRTVRQGLWVALTIGVAAQFLFAASRGVLAALGQEADLIVVSSSYLDVRGLGLLPGLVFLVLSHCLSAHGRPRAIMLVALGAILLNALGNYALMFGNFGMPRMELVGAAVASVCVDLFAAVALMVFVSRDRRFRRYHLLARLWRPDWPRYREILWLGLPIAGAILAETGLFLASTFLMGRLGEAQLAGHAVAVQCASVAFMVPQGLGQAATVRVGLAAGAHDLPRARRTGWTALVIGCMFMLVPAFAFWFFADRIAGWFLDPQVPENLAAWRHATVFLGVAAVFQLVDGAQCMANGVLRGLRDTRVPMLIAVFSYWGLGFVAALWFGFSLEQGGSGVWVGLAFGLGAAALLLTARFAWRTRAAVIAAV